MKKILLNPYFIYIIIFCFILILYQFNWSNLFPPLNYRLLIFLIFTFIVYLIIGIIFKKKKKNLQSDIKINAKKIKNNIRLIILGYILEFIYCGYIPIFSLGSSSQFVHFGGIPTIHVILVTYNVFFSCIVFQVLLEKFSKKTFFEFLIITFFPPLLIVNRGMLMTEALACMILYIIFTKNSSLKIVRNGLVASVILLWGFAKIGSVRINDIDGNKIIIAYTDPSKKFEKTGLSPIVLWPYMYIASPLGNLQLCIDKVKPEYNLYKFVALCICPDFISKRIFGEVSLKQDILISPSFNVSTMYYISYITMGYYGMLLLFSYQSLIIYICLFTSSAKNNKYYSVIFSLIMSTTILCTFSNMWIFSAISFPFIWGFILNFFSKKKIKIGNGCYCNRKL